MSIEELVLSAKKSLELASLLVKTEKYRDALSEVNKAFQASGGLVSLAFGLERSGNLSESLRCFYEILSIRNSAKKAVKQIREWVGAGTGEVAAALAEADKSSADIAAALAHGYCMIAYSRVLGSIDKPGQSIALADAKLWAKKSLEDRVALYGIRHDEVANGLELLGAIYHLSGNTTKGFSCFKEVAEMRAELNRISALETERVCQFSSPSVRFQKFSHAQALSVIAGISPEGRQEEFSRSFSETFADKEVVSPFKFLEFLQEKGLELPRTNILQKRASALEDSRVGRAVRAASSVAVAGGFAAAVREQEAAASAGGHGR